MQREPNGTGVELRPLAALTADQPESDDVGVERDRAIHVARPVVDVVDRADHRRDATGRGSLSPARGPTPSGPGTLLRSGRRRHGASRAARARSWSTEPPAAPA